MQIDRQSSIVVDSYITKPTIIKPDVARSECAMKTHQPLTSIVARGNRTGKTHPSGMHSSTRHPPPCNFTTRAASGGKDIREEEGDK
jgi:hypothetical protein